jgi:hypothetical protein
LLRPVRFLRGFVLRQLSEKGINLPLKITGPPGFTRWISVPFASLGGEPAAIRANKILLPPAIDAAREREGQICSERCSCTIIARSFVFAHEIPSMTDRVIERLKLRPLHHTNSKSRSAALPVSPG